MRYPNFSNERELWSQGIATIAGVDEVGRGAWAGPIVAAAVILNDRATKKLRGVRDSKLLSPKQREYLYEVIIEQATSYSIGSIAPDIIDTIGIGAANRQAFIAAIAGLTTPPEMILLDGLPVPLSQPTRSIISGDRKVYSIAAASVVAKVARDRMMVQLATTFPEYYFDQHKGYGTAAHQRALKKHGPCIIHRKSYAPVARSIKKNT
jgi:ribonuclease HII